jgi:hypothetical protein
MKFTIWHLHQLLTCRTITCYLLFAVHAGQIQRNIKVGGKKLLQSLVPTYQTASCYNPRRLQPASYQFTHPSQKQCILPDSQYSSSRQGKMKLSSKSPTVIMNEISMSISAEGKQQGIRLEMEFQEELSLSLSLALQPFGPWLLFQFLNLIQNWQDSLDGGSECRKATTYTQHNTNTE